MIGGSGFFEALKIAHLSASLPPRAAPLHRMRPFYQNRQRVAEACGLVSASIFVPSNQVRRKQADMSWPTRSPHHLPRASSPTAFAAVFPLCRTARVEPSGRHRTPSVILHEFKPSATRASLAFAFGLELFSSFCRACVSSTFQKSSLIEAFPISSISRTVDRPRVIAH